VTDPAVRAALTAELATTQERIRAMTRDFDEVVAASAHTNADDEHDPEGPTIAFERAQIAALLAEARRHLDELARATARLDDGSYGSCERCGEPIGPERLAARPATHLCIRCAAGRRGR
jgi:DnaK suppressor protein